MKPLSEAHRGAHILPGLAIAVIAIAGAVFFAIAGNVLTGQAMILFDIKITAWLHAHGTPQLNRLFMTFTNLHAMLAIAIYTAVLALVLAWKREWRWLWTVGLVVPGGLVLNWLLKHAYQRARPVLDQPLLIIDTYSFPSAHTAGAVLFYGVLAAYLIARLESISARIVCTCAAILLAALVAFSRVYLGVHYLSDVLAAAAASSAWLALCLLWVHAHYSRAARRHSQ